MEELDEAGLVEVRQTLKSFIDSSGGRYLLNHIKEVEQQGVDDFIALPVAQKTSKASFNFQARYEVMKKLREWIEAEIKCV